VQINSVEIVQYGGKMWEKCTIDACYKEICDLMWRVSSDLQFNFDELNMPWGRWELERTSDTMCLVWLVGS
jgi:hypothetical protein